MSGGRVVAGAMCQNLGPAVLKYNGQRIGEIQHEARSRCSAPVNGRSDQIVANGVGQTAVDGTPATCGSLSLMADEAAGRCDSQTPQES